MGGSDEAQEQGLSVPHWTIEGSTNGPVPTSAWRARSLGDVHPGQEGWVALQGWLCLDDPGSRPIAHCSADPYVACDDDRPLK